MERKKHIKLNFFVKILLVFLLIFAFTLPFASFTKKTFAQDEIVYSNVLDDLKKDESFDSEKYVIDENDFSLKVIQIAESVNRELFVYVYQPCSPNDDLTATSINISTTIGDDLRFQNYKLKLINSCGVFYKYVVDSFVVIDDSSRYYEIASIFRLWNEKYDKESESNNTIGEVSYEVGKQYTVVNSGETVTYSVSDVEVIRITDKYVGFVRYNGGYQWNGITYEKADNHFVAFRTDHDIDVLLEADVYYTERSYHYYYKQSLVTLTSPTVKYGDVEEKIANLSYESEEDYQGNVFHKRYTWREISSVKDFISHENMDFVYHIALIGDVRTQTSLSVEGTLNLLNKQWVLRFATTNYSYTHLNGFIGDKQVSDDITEIDSTEVMDVSILRLRFKSEGNVFNLGVVDNMQSGDSEPDNETKVEFTPEDWLQAIISFFRGLFGSWWKILLFVLAVIIIVALLPVILPCLIWLIKNIFKLIWWFLKGLWWVFTLPYTIFKNKH